MAQSKSFGQVKTVDLTRGLFIIRYATAEDEFQPPKITIAVDPPAHRGVDFILHPDADDTVLWQPGAALVVRTTSPAKLLIEVTPVHGAGSTAANVKIERISQGEPTAVSTLVAAPPAAIDLGAMRVLGHVAGIGDVMVGANEWIAGPAAPSRIEGIAIEWPSKPPQLDIRYSVKLGRPQAGPSRMLEIGSYAGTRGQAMPLTGAAFEVSGATSADYQLCVEAAFLGSPTMRVVGKRVVVSGPTGREPLVGLRVNLEPLAAAIERETSRPAARPVTTTRVAPMPVPMPAPMPAPLPIPQPPPAAKASSRVRVFRSRSKEDKSPA